MKQEKGKNYYPLFDRSGKAVYYLDVDKIHIYSWEGEPVGFVEKGAVFNFQGEHLGWYEEGWLRDRDGKCVGFAEPGKGGPREPRTRPAPAPPAEKKDPPPKPEISKLPERPPRRPVWSELTDYSFFKAGRK